MMDAFIKAEVHEYSAYLTTGNGDVWRVWFHHDGFPLQERIIESQISELNGLRLRARRHERERIAWMIREKKQGFDIPQDIALEMADAIIGSVKSENVK